MSGICLRCGNPLPDGSYLTRKYCDKCGAERKKELRRERERIAREQSIAAHQEKQDAADREYCKPCIYRGSVEYGNNLCDYILLTGKRRGCKAGVGCTERVISNGKSDIKYL